MAKVEVHSAKAICLIYIIIIIILIIIIVIIYYFLGVVEIGFICLALDLLEYILYMRWA